MEERGRKANIPLKMNSERGDRGGRLKDRKNVVSFFITPSTHKKKRGRCTHIVQREGKQEPNHYHLHGEERVRRKRGGRVKAQVLTW